MNRPARSLGAFLLVVAVLFVLPAAIGASEPTDTQRIDTFKKLLRSKDPKARARAFEHLRGVRTAAGIDAVLWGVKQLEKDAVGIRAAQQEAEELYEKLINDLRDAQMEFESSPQSSRDLDRYNKRERKLSKARDGQIKRLKNLENDFSRGRAQVQQALLVADQILESLSEGDLGLALAKLNQAWLKSKDVEDRLRWLDAVGEVDRPLVTDSLHAVVDDEDMPLLVRAGAIDSLAARRDGRMLAKAIRMLALSTDQSGLLVAAIAALRRMHDKRAIEPLMEFLERTDIKRTREDACRALGSLTGQDHGAYAGEWRKWWEDAKADFVMPKDPKPPGPWREPEKGGTFYGIHTFSDRVLFIIDISGSMDRPQRGKDAGGRTKMEVCRQQLVGFVYKLNDGDLFNVIFFNHQVIPWQAKKVVARDKTKKMLAKWVEEQPPLGGTNIFDALERGFLMAVFGMSDGKRPIYDTIFFLTDGKPTAGKLTDPEKILEVVRAWNQRAKLTIHCVGIGKDHDADFLRALAKIGDGEYRAH